MVKNKGGICMADGGIPRNETADELMARMTAKYGAPSAGPAQPAAQPVQQVAPVQPAPKRGIVDGIRGMFGDRQKQLDAQERKANGYANGGIAAPMNDMQTRPSTNIPPQPGAAGRVAETIGRAIDSTVDHPAYNFAQAVPGVNIPLSALAYQSHASRGMTGDAVLDAVSAIPGARATQLIPKVVPNLSRGSMTANAMRVGTLAQGAQMGQSADAFAKGYADGGISGHVKFKGEGGPREDKIPVVLSGQKINVSNDEEHLIIPAKTAANAQAMAEIKKIIADSNDGRQPDMGHGDDNYAEGGLLDDEARKMDYQKVTGIAAPSPTPVPAAQPETGGWGFGKSGPGATLQVTTGDAARLPSAVQRQGINAMRSQMATPQTAAASGSSYVGNGPTDPDTNGRNAMARPGGAVARGITTMRGQLNQNPMVSESAIASAAGEDHLRSLYPTGTFDQSAAQAQSQNPMNSGYTVTRGQAEAGRIRAANQGIMAASPSNARTQAAADGNESDLAGRQGGYMVENNLREFRDVGNGITAQRGSNGRLSVSNVGTENITDPSKRAVDDSASARRDFESSGGRTPQMQLDTMVRNRMMSDLTDPSITDPAVRERAAIALGIAGRPEDNQLKQAQAQGIAAQTDSTQMLSGIQKKALAGDPQAMASYRTLTGKAADNRFTAHVVGGGVNEMGQAQPQYLGVTGPDGRVQFHKPSQQGQQSFGKADVDAALKGGADRAKVAERIKSMGGNPADYGL